MSSQTLAAPRAGRAADALLPKVYDQLQSLAAAHLQREPVDHTLEPAALVNEVYLKLARRRSLSESEPAMFFSLAAATIRRVLVDHARRRAAAKRGGRWRRVGLEDEPGCPAPDVTLIALDEAMEKLAAQHERQARIVELRFFTGLQVDEVAHLLGVSPRTVADDWARARQWLRDQLE